MIYTTLKHKTLQDTYGHFMRNYTNDEPEYGQYEIAHGMIPELRPIECTMEGLKHYWRNHPNVIKQLDDYEIVVVNVHPVKMP
jgi:hypothetical protein